MKDRIQDLFSIEGKRIAVTGAGGILYGSICRALAANGAKVALLDIAGDKVEEAAKSIREAGGEAIAITCSVLDEKSMEAARGTVVEAFGGCDALIMVSPFVLVMD